MPLLPAAVCGDDGQTHTNACIAQCVDGVKSWTEGACPLDCTLVRCGKQYEPGEGCGLTGAAQPSSCAPLRRTLPSLASCHLV